MMKKWGKNSNKCTATISTFTQRLHQRSTEWFDLIRQKDIHDQSSPISDDGSILMMNNSIYAYTKECNTVHETTKTSNNQIQIHLQHTCRMQKQKHMCSFFVRNPLTILEAREMFVFMNGKINRIT